MAKAKQVQPEVPAEEVVAEEAIQAEEVVVEESPNGVSKKFILEGGTVREDF